MAGKPHENIDCSFFDDIINGHLRPFLPIYDDISEIHKLNSITMEFEFTQEQQREWIHENIFPTEVKEKFNIRDGDEVVFQGFNDNTIGITISKSADFLEPLIDIDIPPPIDEKSEEFLNLIEREFETMKIKAQNVLKSSKSDQQLAFYSNKNIQILKQVAQQSGRIIKQFSDTNKDYSNDSNAYIIHIAKVFLIRAIMFYQELFEPFTKVPPEDYYNLKVILYGDKHPAEFAKKLETRYKTLKYESITDIFDYINSGILQLELFIKGNIKEIQFHNISGAFVKLFQEIIKIENFTQANIDLLDKYYAILSDIIFAHEDGNYKENIDIENKLFNRMIKEVSTTNELIENFVSKHDLIPNDYYKQHSILDIILNKEQSHVQSTLKINSNSIPPPKAPTEKIIIPVSYTYKKYPANFSALSDTLDSLKKNKFVAQDTDLKDFRKIFNNTIPDKPITWTGNISELSYFIKLLHNDFKFISDLKSNIWKVTAKLFVDTNGSFFEGKRFRGQKTPAKAKADLLEKAVVHLK